MTLTLTTIEEVRQLLEPVFELPQGTPALSVETYRAVKPIQAALTKLIADIWRNIPRHEAQALKRDMLSMMCGGRRKHSGTGSFDTPEKTWEKMRAASIAGEPLRSLSKRFGVLYHALTVRAREDGYRGKPWHQGPPDDVDDTCVQLNDFGPPPGRPSAAAPHLRILDGGQAAKRGP